MNTTIRLGATACLLSLLALTACSTRTPHVTLDSWNEGEPRNTITDFTRRVSTLGNPDYVPPSQRIAVFDNDGTLWAEQPAYFQLLFALDRVGELGPANPEWHTTQPYKAALERDVETLASLGHEAIFELVMATHAGMTSAEFETIVREWISTARHPDTDVPYTQMVYRPMLELLDHLRSRGFTVYIVSGGGVEFMRVFAEEIYGIPPQHVIGSSVSTQFITTADGPSIQRLAEINSVNDKEGKPLNIHRVIGQRPIAAFGNSDGDLQMLQWTDARDGASLCALVHHTDRTREWAYDRKSHIGRLDRALDEATQRDWIVIDMSTDWRTVFDHDEPEADDASE